MRQPCVAFDAYMESTCPACAGTYRITVTSAEDETRVHREWVAGRPCALCIGASKGPPVPARVSDAVAAAWDVLVRASADTGLELHLSVVPRGGEQAEKAG